MNLEVSQFDEHVVSMDEINLHKNIKMHIYSFPVFSYLRGFYILTSREQAIYTFFLQLSHFS